MEMAKCLVHVMLSFWFAACLVVDLNFDEGFRINRCYAMDREVCEQYFDECYEGRIKLPIRRRTK